MSSPILPGAVLGVLGGGQLGRMFALAARSMGYRVTVFAPEDDSPAGQTADREIRADYDDLDAVRRFADSVDVVTFEFENVPADTAAAASDGAPVRPAGSLLHTTQHRAREKAALSAAGVPTVRYELVESDEALRRAMGSVGLPGILKTASWGYDGKGQRRIAEADDAIRAWDELGRVPAVYEAVAEFEREISVVGARGTDGAVALYAPSENRHVHHVLDVSISPADLPQGVVERAHGITRTLLEAWDVVGVLCVELFLLPDGPGRRPEDRLLVNEIAPRPHNSGHLTLDGHSCSQFEQQVRAVCGLPLGSTEALAPAVMANLLGDLWLDRADGRTTPPWDAACAVPGVSLHLYGKAEPRPGRKMGHLTAVGKDRRQAEERVLAARSALLPG